MYQYVFNKLYKCKVCGEQVVRGPYSISAHRKLEYGRELESKFDNLLRMYLLKEDSSELHCCGSGRVGYCEEIGMQILEVKEEDK